MFQKNKDETDNDIIIIKKHNIAKVYSDEFVTAYIKKGTKYLDHVSTSSHSNSFQRQFMNDYVRSQRERV